MPVRSSCPSGLTRIFSFVSPIGELELISCARGIHSLKQKGEKTDDVFQPKLGQKVELSTGPEEPYPPVKDAVNWLQCYFHGGDKIKTLPLPPICHFMSPPANFQQKVWKMLAENVRFGEAVSYGKLAEMCDSPRASQAVGSAMRNNPVSFIVPCHRVILSSGKSGNYSGGQKNSLKVWLLEHEGYIKTD